MRCGSRRRGALRTQERVDILDRSFFALVAQTLPLGELVAVEIPTLRHVRDVWIMNGVQDTNRDDTIHIHVPDPDA